MGSEVLFRKSIIPVSHQWCLHVNKGSKKGARKGGRRGSPSAQEWPNVAVILWSQGLSSSKMIRSKDLDKIAC